MRCERPVISLAIMYHPAREHLLPALVEGCRPLAARLIQDPEPDGPPSPLRTAKRAWAAVPPGATHHAVLQDDVVPIVDFARHLQAAVAQQPHDVIALHVMWNAPINAYFARRAAAFGWPWARLSPHEWVPCQGLVMPAATAARLAAYLRTFPDEEKTDDELVKRYCKRAGLAVLATLPHLVEHLTVPSVADNDEDGVRTGAVPAGPTAPPPDQFAVPAPPPYHSAVAAAPVGWDAGWPALSLRMRRSECRVRLLPHDVRTDHGWIPDEPWRRVVDQLGLAEETVLAGFEDAAARQLAAAGAPATLAPVPESVAAELWAYAWLMGYDGSRMARPGPGAARAGLRETAVRTLIGSGLLEPHAAAMTPALAEAHARLALDAFHVGCSAATRATEG